MGPGSTKSMKQASFGEMAASLHNLQPGKNKLKFEEFKNIKENPYEYDHSPEAPHTNFGSNLQRAEMVKFSLNPIPT